MSVYSLAGFAAKLLMIEADMNMVTPAILATVLGLLSAQGRNRFAVAAARFVGAE